MLSVQGNIKSYNKMAFLFFNLYRRVPLGLGLFTVYTWSVSCLSYERVHISICLCSVYDSVTVSSSWCGCTGGLLCVPLVLT